MKVLDLSGKLHVLSMNFPMKAESVCRSKLQYECGQKLLRKYPMTVILEDVSIPGEHLYLDFLIPNRRLAFEIQGLQHDKFVSFFHKTKGGFFKSQDRDDRKQKWCDLNNIELIKISKIEDLD